LYRKGKERHVERFAFNVRTKRGCWKERAGNIECSSEIVNCGVLKVNSLERVEFFVISKVRVVFRVAEKLNGANQKEQ